MSSVDPIHFGADPLGVIDSTAAIQAALDTGKSVDFTLGVYKTSSRLDQVTSGQKVNGHGAQLVTTGDHNGWQIGTEGARESNMALRDLTIRYNGSEPSSSTGLILVEMSQALVESVDVIATGATGFAVGLDIRAVFSGSHYNRIIASTFIACNTNAMRLSLDFDNPNTGSANENKFIGVRFNCTAGADSCILFRHNAGNPNKASNGCTFVGVSCEGFADYAIRMRGGTANTFTDVRTEGTWAVAGIRLEAPTRSNYIQSAWNSNASEVVDEGEKNKIQTATASWHSMSGSDINPAAGNAYMRFLRRDGNNNTNRVPLIRVEDNDTEHPTTNTGPSQMFDLEAEFNTHADAYFMQGSSLSGPTVQFRVTGLGQGRFGGGLTLDAAGAGSVISEGTSTPEGALTRPIGSTFHRTDGGATTTFYVKEVGTGNTGWEGMASRSYVDAPGITAFSGASATFDAAGVRVATIDADATDVTDFTNGVASQSFILIATGARQIEHSASIALEGSVDFDMVSGSTLTLVNDGSKWFETGRRN